MYFSIQVIENVTQSDWRKKIASCVTKQCRLHADAGPEAHCCLRDTGPSALAAGFLPDSSLSVCPQFPELMEEEEEIFVSYHNGFFFNWTILNYVFNPEHGSVSSIAIISLDLRCPVQ